MTDIYDKSGKVSCMTRALANIVGIVLVLFINSSFASSLNGSVEPALPIITGLVHGGTAKAPAPLPSNALGALFLTDATISAQDFQITQVESNTKAAVRIVALRKLQITPRAGLANVKPLRQNFYRIEPVDGFVRGKTYLFEYVRSARTIPYLKNKGYFHIDDKPVDLNEARVELIGKPNRENAMYPDACPRDPYGVAAMQLFRINGPEHWKPYRYRIFTLLDPVDSSWHVQDRVGSQSLRLNFLDSRVLQMWEVHPRYMCLGSMRGQAVEVAMSVYLAFPEIDDGWRQAKQITFTIRKDQLTNHDSLSYLDEAIRSGVTFRIVEVLKAIPIRATDEAAAYRTDNFPGWIAALARSHTDRKAVARRAELSRRVIGLGNHPDAGVRAAAAQAATRILRRPIAVEDPIHRIPP